MIDIIVPVYNNLGYTKLFLLSLGKQTFKDYRLIIINNGSNDGTLQFLENFSKKLPIEIINNEKNLGYVKAINIGLRITRQQYVLLGNNDTILPSNLLAKLVNCIGEYDIVSVYSNKKHDSLNNSELLVEYSGEPSIKDINLFAKNLDLKFKDTIIDVDAVFGHCLFMKRSIIDEVGFLDERFGVGNYDDIDFCKRAQNKGFKIGLIKGAFIYHFCHATFDYLGVDIEDILKKNFILFNEKWQ